MCTEAAVTRADCPAGTEGIPSAAGGSGAGLVLFPQARPSTVAHVLCWLPTDTTGTAVDGQEAQLWNLLAVDQPHGGGAPLPAQLFHHPARARLCHCMWPLRYQVQQGAFQFDDLPVELPLPVITLAHELQAVGVSRVSRCSHTGPGLQAAVFTCSTAVLACTALCPWGPCQAAAQP